MFFPGNPSTGKRIGLRHRVQLLEQPLCRCLIVEISQQILNRDQAVEVRFLSFARQNRRKELKRVTQPLERDTQSMPLHIAE